MNGYAMKDDAERAAAKMASVTGRVCKVYYDSKRQIHKWTFRITELEKENDYIVGTHGPNEEKL